MEIKKIRELGRGGFGKVYLANHEIYGDVAVKEIQNIEDITSFEREIRLLKEHINNKYVVDIYDHDLKANPPYLVMEFCEGGSLREYVGKLNWKLVATSLCQAAQGLLDIHNAGGFHRDIKPDNLLLAKVPNKTGYITKVADFGLARRPNTVKPPMTRQPCGTEGYMAPELNKPSAQFSASADIYSLGITGIELLTDSILISDLEKAKAPKEFKDLLKKMTYGWAIVRPSIQTVIISLRNIIKSTNETKNTTSKNIKALALIGIGLLAISALSNGDQKNWNKNVQRKPIKKIQAKKLNRKPARKPIKKIQAKKLNRKQK